MKHKRSKNKVSRIIVILLIQILLLTVLYSIAAGIYYKANYRQWCISNEYRIQENNEDLVKKLQEYELNEPIIKNKRNREILTLTTTATGCEQGEMYLMITDRETGEIITDSKERVFLIFTDSEADSHKVDYTLRQYIFINESESLISWIKNVKDEFYQIAEEDDKYNLFYSADNYYLSDDGYFYPIKMSAYYRLSYGEGEINKYENWQADYENQDYEANSNDVEITDDLDNNGVYVAGSKTTLSDYPMKGKEDKENYLSGWGENHTYEFPILITRYYEYNRSFLKGDFMCIQRTPFIVTETDPDNSNGVTVKNYVLETYYKSNYWEISGKNRLIPILIIYSFVLFLSTLITLIICILRLIRKEKEEYRKILVNSISHDLKSPLTTLRGYAESLKENLNEDKRVQYSEAILESTDYMNHLINGNIELLRLEDMGSVGKKEVVDFVKLSKSLLEKYNPALEERGITVEVSGEYEKKVNKELITNALENLISNSVKYVSDNGAISILGDKDGYTISNTTDALPDKKPKELWETFVKGDDSRSNEKGSGLGLAIAKQILDKHKIKAKINYKKDTDSFEVNLY